MIASHRWDLWSTYAHLAVTEPARLDAARALLDEHLARIELACSRFRPDSETERLPTGGAEVSDGLAHLVRVALDAATATDGDVDPTVGASLGALGYDRDIRLVVDGSEVGVAIRAPGWQQVTLSGRHLTVPAGVTLDLGATAKAAAADLGAQLVHRSLGCGVLVNLGGDIATAGPAPAGGWQVTVRDLDDDPGCQVTLDGALATSSTARRTWRRGGMDVHHIVDPATGLPAPTHWRTVTVVADTCVEANTVSTAAVVRGERALDWVRRRGLPARLVDERLRVHTLNGWPAESVAAA